MGLKKNGSSTAVKVLALVLAGTFAAVPAANVLASSASTQKRMAGVAAALDQYKQSNVDMNAITSFLAGLSDGADPVDEVTEQEEQAAAAKTSPYENVAIAQVADGSNVNIRAEANTSSEITGKISNHAAATILEAVEGEDGIWYKIESGNASGYVKAMYFVTGDEAEEIAREVGTILAQPTTSSLRLREEPTTNSSMIEVLSETSQYAVLEEGIVGDDGLTFDKILLFGDSENDEDAVIGYACADYLETTVEFETALSMDEIKEQQRLAAAAEEAKQKIAEERAAAAAESAAASAAAQSSAEAAASEAAARAAAQAAAEAAARAAATTTEAPTSATRAATTAAPTTASSYSSSSSSSLSAKRSYVVDRATSLVGVIPYVYGGNSLTTGTDCSGFTKLIYAEIGISLPRVANDQQSSGYAVSEDELLPGDLVCYSGHVAIYIGNGQICHAANSRRNIVIDNLAGYMEVVCYRRVIY